ncbi:MAG: hypothetical protein IJB61_06990 [Bacteroides sp]|nr:hypothetical protein [Bacteroides sp.]
MRKITHERTKFLEKTYDDMLLYFNYFRITYSRPGIRFMKLIINQLQYELYLIETERLKRLRNEGKVTPKEALKMMAKLKCKYLHRNVKTDG